MVSSIIPQCGVLKNVHKNQMCVLTFSQTLSPQGFSALQLIEASSSDQSTVVLSDISTVFPHEPKPFQLHRQLQQLEKWRLRFCIHFFQF